MGFKSMNQYTEEKNKDFFVLPNDGDCADVIFLYHSINDPVIATAHYILAGDKTGYYFCCEDNCPACQPGPGRNKPIYRSDKLFIPFYNLTKGRIEVWDRSARFRDQLVKDVFNQYPDPSGYVFRIQRHGEARSVDTTYSITAVNTNNSITPEQILANAGVTLDQVYEMVIKEITPFEMKLMLDGASTAAANNTAAAYGATPRGTFTPPVQIAPPEVTVETPAVTLPTSFEAPTDINVPVTQTIPNEEITSEETDEEIPTLDDLGDVNF